MTEGELTEEELNALSSAISYGAPVPEEKHNVHSFLSKVAKSGDTTKTGNIAPEELGRPVLSMRACKELALISEKILGNDFFRDFFLKEAEIITSTSLSKDAKLLELAVVQRRELADVTTEKQKKENKGWFKPKNPEPSGM